MTLLVGVLVASLVGSIHCAAMCGGFVCVYAGASTPRGLANLPAHLAYNGGRLVSYVTLGVIAGAIGARVDDLGRFAGFSRGAAVLAGTLMVAWALGIIVATMGVRVPGTLAPEWAKRRLGAALVAMRDRPPVARAAVTGLLTTLLPCGWLYTFVVTAGGTGSPLDGAGVMFAFWLGTVPDSPGARIGSAAAAGPRAPDGSRWRARPSCSCSACSPLPAACTRPPCTWADTPRRRRCRWTRRMWPLSAPSCRPTPRRHRGRTRAPRARTAVSKCRAASWTPGAERQFCCTGCRTAFAILHEHGLDQYYRLGERREAAVAPTGRTYAEFDHDAFQQLYVRAAPGRTRAGGPLSRRRALRLVRVARGARPTAPARCGGRRAGDPTIAGPRGLGPRGRAAVARRAACSIRSATRPTHSAACSATRSGGGRTARCSCASAWPGRSRATSCSPPSRCTRGGCGGMEHEWQQFFRWVSFLLVTPALLWPGRVFFSGAWAALRTRTLHMDVPVALGLAVGYLQGAVNTVRDCGPHLFRWTRAPDLPAARGPLPAAARAARRGRRRGVAVFAHAVHRASHRGRGQRARDAVRGAPPRHGPRGATGRNAGGRRRRHARAIASQRGAAHRRVAPGVRGRGIGGLRGNGEPLVGAAGARGTGRRVQSRGEDPPAGGGERAAQGAGRGDGQSDGRLVRGRGAGCSRPSPL